MNLCNRKKTKKGKTLPLPKSIRDKLRMTCALRGYSDMKCGKSKKLNDQYDDMYTFFHGKPPDHPSQIHLLANANIIYKDLYESVDGTSTKKSNEQKDVTTYYLKTNLS